MRPKVIWIDDDNAAHEPFLRYLQKAGLIVKPLSTFADGLAEIRSLGPGQQATEFSLLLDVMLPRTSQGIAVVPYLGLELALEAAKAGIPRICFLTVVRIAHAKNSLEELQRLHPFTSVMYEDKMTLLDRPTLQRIVHFLSSEEKPD